MVNDVEVTIRGHVGHEPTIFRGEGRRSFLRLNVASTPRIRSREGEWSDGATQWFAVKLFGDLAENAAVSIRKGDAVLVRGRLEHEEYDTREGERRWTAVIMAEAFGPDLRYASAHVARNVRRASATDGGGDEDSANANGGAPESAPVRTPESSVDTSAFAEVSTEQEPEDQDPDGELEQAEETIAARIG